jgi:hypothetical protein
MSLMSWRLTELPLRKYTDIEWKSTKISLLAAAPSLAMKDDIIQQTLNVAQGQDYIGEGPTCPLVFKV